MVLSKGNDQHLKGEKGINRVFFNLLLRRML